MQRRLWRSWVNRLFRQRKPRVPRRQQPPLPRLFLLEDRSMPGETLGAILAAVMAHKMLNASVEAAEVGIPAAQRESSSEQWANAVPGQQGDREPARVVWLPLQSSTSTDAGLPDADPDLGAPRPVLTGTVGQRDGADNQGAGPGGNTAGPAP
jgi:hypothetical protein